MSSLPDSPSPSTGTNSILVNDFPVPVVAFPGAEAVPALLSQLTATKAYDRDELTGDMNTWPHVTIRGTRYMLEEWLYKKRKRSSWIAEYGVRRIWGSHDGDNLGHAILNVLTEFGLRDAVGYFQADNARIPSFVLPGGTTA
ncbi:hypothetical protein B0T26DRAFT_745261 [Lasiosphaeria miniovina]|uniref:Uncharacterized protein n=1 Tax=Lasiosphaeria miniovina TaxID=1954250 RepID=A0AA40BF98_9PEZI|nr:uncharacterized protein B0T26DRAFT_745261 [Lasiosphaeria miniovina]KAK0733187.1 hypothetical protein B0T26DRAFT_745261 [Lasiosphaeria miniovina]